MATNKLPRREPAFIWLFLGKVILLLITIIVAVNAAAYLTKELAQRRYGLAMALCCRCDFTTCPSRREGARSSRASRSISRRGGAPSSSGRTAPERAFSCG